MLELLRRLDTTKAPLRYPNETAKLRQHARQFIGQCRNELFGIAMCSDFSRYLIERPILSLSQGTELQALPNHNS
jgi:hypothetical protein